MTLTDVRERWWIYMSAIAHRNNRDLLSGPISSSIPDRHRDRLRWHVRQVVQGRLRAREAGHLGISIRSARATDRLCTRVAWRSSSRTWCACRRRKSKTPALSGRGAAWRRLRVAISVSAATTAWRSRRRLPIADVTRGLGDDVPDDGEARLIRGNHRRDPDRQCLRAERAGSAVRKVSVQARVATSRLRRLLDRTSSPTAPLVAVRRHERHRR